MPFEFTEKFLGQDNYLPNLKLHVSLHQFEIQDSLPTKSALLAHNPPQSHKTKSDVSISNQYIGIDQVNYSNVSVAFLNSINIHIIYTKF